jgi:hypothetical protein
VIARIAAAVQSGRFAGGWFLVLSVVVTSSELAHRIA